MDEANFRRAIVDGLCQAVSRHMPELFKAVERAGRATNPYHINKFRRNSKRRQSQKGNK
jgi:hypothetical protein